MIPRSKIYIKGEKEPMIVFEEQAKKIDAAFRDSAISLNTVFHIGRASRIKADVRGVYVLKDLNEESEKTSQWVIFSPKKRSIWDRPFNTFEEAKAEYDFQMLNISPADREKLDWIIEKR